MRPVAVFIALLIILPPAAGQELLPGGPQVAVQIPYEHDSGLHSNPGPAQRVVHQHVLYQPGADSLRVFFKDVRIGPDDRIVVAHPFNTRNVHHLTQLELDKWGNSSAYFNGDRLVITLVLAPGSEGHFAVSHVLAGIPVISPESICGTDDRVPSTDNRVSRFLSNSGGGCTGWLVGADSCALSAGHCFSSGMAVAEFNVPPSNSNGSINHPPVNDQFPINQSSITFLNGGVGADWGVCLIDSNQQGQFPATLYGFFSLGFFMPATSETTRITGFGTDSGTSNQTNQTDTGPYHSTSGTALRYTVDTNPGNSGSPVIHESTGNAVGIHTHGGCGSNGYNQGTSLTRTDFQNAYQATCAQGPPAPPSASFTSNVTTVIQGGSVQFTDQSSGIPTAWDWDLDGDGITDSTARNPVHTYNMAGTFDVSLTVTNSLGSDTLTMTGYITVNPITPASPPYTQDFSGGLPGGGEWTFSSDVPAGRIITSSGSTPSPVSGNPALVMDSSVSGQYATNEAVLHLDMTGVCNAGLSFWFMESSDENDPEDGVFISDGTTTVQAVSLQNGPQSWTSYNVDLVATASAAGMNLDAGFKVIFRHRDNFPVPTDGFFFDDISVNTGTGGFGLTADTTGQGDLSLALCNFPASTAEGFTLASLDTSLPVGNGSVLGINADLLTLAILSTPTSPANPFHFEAPFVQGVYPLGTLSVGPGSVPTGITADIQVVALDGSLGILGATNVVRLTF